MRRTAARLSSELGEPQRRLREFDSEWYVDGRKPLGLTEFQALPVPGRISIGSETVNELEVYPADGHTRDGIAFWVPWAEVLICGDYLSPVEIPMISAESGGSLETYRETLFRFSPLVNRAATVIPGHGAPITGERALEILAEDLAYLDALAAGGDVTLPDGRRSATQKQIHERNRRVSVPLARRARPTGPEIAKRGTNDVRERSDRERVDDGSDPDVPAQRPADREHRQLDAGAHDADLVPSRSPAHHQPVARAGSKARRRCRRRSRRRSTARHPASARQRHTSECGVWNTREHRVDRQADEDRVADRAQPGTLAQRDPEQRVRRR